MQQDLMLKAIAVNFIDQNLSLCDGFEAVYNYSFESYKMY